MQITIIGAGNMARGIATRALAGGHTVTLTAKDPAKAARLAEELSAQAAGDAAVRVGDDFAVAPPNSSSWPCRSPPRRSSRPPSGPG
ncbi:NAD(P)-binding domain-containing protein [Streptomyces tibetensis]|uniref:NAD(P)-binding domain-containing protein n=1 Tax=Streptomyces tibetensis TaxID=2382123 RepID=UPI0033FC72AA